MPRMRLRSSLWIVAMTLSGVLPSQSLAADTTTAPTVAAAEYRIGSEDVLDISVRNNPELEKVVPVRPDGKISLPLINDVVAAGLTPMELRDALTEKFSNYIQNAEVSVVVRE